MWLIAQSYYGAYRPTLNNTNIVFTDFPFDKSLTSIFEWDTVYLICTCLANTANTTQTTLFKDTFLKSKSPNV